ncbi:hypothetical protein EVB39_081 [Rhizobium phage RHph_TM3_3_9]|nr:hypothetical protein EVB39_081 [Rhizobium phage RHph_TM3_3_9]QIG68602.1 hypothetical protein EVB66_081 [Rhizobium phage RHph_TM3_3_13]QIG74460.1 hypothetical protein EVC09_080 [Rhizobium phage RHph_TM3_3_10]QXV74574.1 hypothetical protein [Rhizobium phage RHEph19]
MISIWLNDTRAGSVIRSYVKIHHLPRIGEQLSMDGRRYRVVDIIHEAIDDEGTWKTHIVVIDLGRPEW